MQQTKDVGKCKRTSGRSHPLVRNVQAQECRITSDKINKFGNSLLVEAQINNRHCPSMVDTGASRSVLRPDLISSDANIKPTNIILRMANDVILKVVGEIRICFFIDNCKFWHTFVVAYITDECILGLDFLKHNKMKIDLEQNIMKYKNWNFLLSVGELKHDCCEVKLLENVIMPPFTEKILKVYAEVEGSRILVIDPDGKKLSNGLMVAKSLSKFADNGSSFIRMANFSPHEFKLNKGTVVGTAGPCVSIYQAVEKSVDKVELPLENLVQNVDKSLSDCQKLEIKDLVTKYQDIFSLSDRDFGRSKIVKHAIDTQDAKPVRKSPRRLPFMKREEAHKIIETMKNDGVIEESESPWCSPVVLVKKKDGTTRFCVDYRGLNDVTKKDSYPLPRIDDTFDALSGSSLFSTLDLKSGYWQVELDERSKEKTAFSIGNGLWQFNVMPFGLCNAPATFERLMESVLRGLNWKTCLVYLDDIIVFGQNFREHLTRLEEVFNRLRQANLKLSPKKCNIFQDEVKYLGHIVSRNGISVDQEKVEKIKSWPIPKNRDELRSFLGLCTYYRKFVNNFATIASPLHTLASKSGGFEWKPECQTAFEILKEHLATTVILSFPVMESEFILDTDASNDGIGAVLSQEVGGKECVIGYYSRKLSKPERNYCVTRKELLAIVDAMKHFHKYLYGQKFKVRTDHAALRWLLNFKQPEGQVARWIERLQGYDFEINHRSGSAHSNADALSRRPCPSNCKQCMRSENRDHVVNRLVILSCESWSEENVRKAQENDPDLLPILQWKIQDYKPSINEISAYSKTTKAYWLQWDSLVIHGSVLKRKWESENGKSTTMQTIVPHALRKDVLKELHNGSSGGHFGINKTISKIREHFYWLELRRDVEDFVKTCTQCESVKGPHRKTKALMQKYVVGSPHERIAVDVAGPFPVSKSGNKYILVVIDYFTKWVEVYPIPNQEAVTVAKVMVNNWVSRFGVPLELHSDQGRNFESAVFQEMCSTMSIKKTRTTPLHPQSDGMVERFNRTLENFLAKVVSSNQLTWDEHIPMFLLAYRCSIHESTGKSPCEMLFGSNVRMPSELLFGSPPSPKMNSTEYGKALKDHLNEIHEEARKNLNKSCDKMKHNYDVKAVPVSFNEGDFVWLYNPQRSVGVCPKFTPKWEGPYTVIKRINDVVYRIRRTPRSKMKVVHVDRLTKYNGSNDDSVT